jgi:hypothetical protein
VSEIKYEIEAQIPAKHSLSGQVYWDPLQGNDCRIYRTTVLEEAQSALKIARTNHTWPCRLVRITKEVIE